MVLSDIIFSLVLSLIIAIVFALGFKHRGPWGTILAFFLLIFLAVWAASIWVSPVGPLLMGYSIIPVAIVGIVFALIVVAASHPDNLQTMKTNKVPDASADEKPSFNTYSVYFWLVMTVLVLVIVFGYFIQYR
jgi:ABC-type branched-subunit amino acid transport system permease subunit